MCFSVKIQSGVIFLSLKATSVPVVMCENVCWFVPQTVLKCSTTAPLCASESITSRPKLGNVFIFGGKACLEVDGTRRSENNARGAGCEWEFCGGSFTWHSEPSHYSHRLLKLFHECWPSSNLFCHDVIDPFTARICLSRSKVGFCCHEQTSAFKVL